MLLLKNSNTTLLFDTFTELNDLNTSSTFTTCLEKFNEFINEESCYNQIVIVNCLLGNSSAALTKCCLPLLVCFILIWLLFSLVKVFCICDNIFTTLLFNIGGVFMPPILKKFIYRYWGFHSDVLDTQFCHAFLVFIWAFSVFFICLGECCSFHVRLQKTFAGWGWVDHDSIFILVNGRTYLFLLVSDLLACFLLAALPHFLMQRKIHIMSSWKLISKD